MRYYAILEQKNMKKNIFKFAILLSVIFTSCNALDKSISEELTLKEIQKAIDNDTLFAVSYKMITEFKELNKEKLKFAKYSKLTWQNMLDYGKFQANDSFWSPLYEKYKKDYKKEYREPIVKGMKLIEDLKNRKEKWLKENNINNFIEIELFGIKTKYYEYSGGIEEVYFKFRLKSKKGRIQQVVWSINPKAKINNNKSSNYLSILDSQRYIYSSPFSKLVTGRYKASYSHQDKAGGKSSKIFLRDYDLNLKLEKVRYQNKNYEQDEFELPFEVKTYLEHKEKSKKDITDSYLTDYYFNEVIKKEIDVNFITENDYILNRADSIFKAKFPLEFNFNNEYIELYTKNNF